MGSRATRNTVRRRPRVARNAREKTISTKSNKRSGKINLTANGPDAIKRLKLLLKKRRKVTLRQWTPKRRMLKSTLQLTSATMKM